MITIANNFLRDRSTESWVSMLLAATLFAIPLSSTGKSILIPVVVLMIILSRMNRQALREVIYQPWCQATLLLFFFAVFACLWGPATPHEKVLVLEKYSKLLYFPIT